jgi:outer membrane protein TolC
LAGWGWGSPAAVKAAESTQEQQSAQASDVPLAPPLIEAADPSETSVAPDLSAEQDALSSVGAAAENDAQSPVYHLRPEPFSDAGKKVVSLKELLDMALAHNQALETQRNNVESGHYDVDKTYYVFDPVFAGEVSYNHSGAGATGSSSTGSYSYSASWTKPMERGDSLAFSYDFSRYMYGSSGAGPSSPSLWGTSYSLNYSRPLLRGAGKWLNLIPRYQASNNLVLGYAKLDDDIRNLKKNVMDVWFDAVAARETIGVRQDSLDVALKELDQQVQRYKVGLAIKSDMLQAENNVLTQRTALLQSRSDYENLLDQLTVLVGTPQEYDLTVDAAEALVDLGAKVPDGVWDLVLANDFDLKNLNTQIANLQLSRESQVNNLKPQLNLGVNYGRTGADAKFVHALGASDDQTYGVKLDFSKTPHERATKADIAQTDLDLNSLQLDIDSTTLALKSALRANERDLETKWEQIPLAENNIKVAQETYDITSERHRVGLATELDVVTAQQNVLAAKLALLQAQVAYKQAYRNIQLQAGMI